MGQGRFDSETSGPGRGIQLMAHAEQGDLPAVDILMATFNGASWVDVQLATLMVQDYPNWRLIVRDDGSTDGTRAILKLWRDRYPDRIVILDEDDPTNLGVAGNFSALMEASTAPYFTLSSWDDLWYRDKVSSSLAALRMLEDEHGAAAPALIYTDLRTVDQDLHEIFGSTLRSIGTSRSANQSLGRYCLENVAYGCTMIGNQALLQRAIPLPPKAPAEDWWLSLVAVCFGKVGVLDKVTLDWRRHGRNDSGFTSLSSSIQGVLRDPLAHRRGFYEKSELGRRNAALFLERYKEDLSDLQVRTLQAFLSLRSLGFWERRAALLRYRLLHGSWMRALGLLLLV